MMKTALILAALLAAAVAVGFAAWSWHRRSREVASGREWLGLLRQHAGYSARGGAGVIFQYASASDGNLKHLRDAYDLETVAGSGSEIERLVNLMRWVHQLAGHASSPPSRWKGMPFP